MPAAATGGRHHVIHITRPFNNPHPQTHLPLVVDIKCSEEKNCRFCAAQLPDWKEDLAPEPETGDTAPPPVMVVSLGDQTHRIQVTVIP